jgi:hypothetical protein
MQTCKGVSGYAQLDHLMDSGGDRGVTGQVEIEDRHTAERAPLSGVTSECRGS